MKTRALILAAGKGSRMKSDLPKVLHKLNDKTMIEYVAEALEIEKIEKIAVVVSSETYTGISNVLGDRVSYVHQREQLGTANAVNSARPWLNGFTGNLVVVVGDAPLITKELMKNLIMKHEQEDAACTLLSAIWENPPPYGRVVRDAEGKMLRIVEEKDATDEEKQIKEVSSSHYCFKTEELFEALSCVDSHNAMAEEYLPDVIGILKSYGEKVMALQINNPYLTYGINSPTDLKRANFYINKDNG